MKVKGHLSRAIHSCNDFGVAHLKNSRTEYWNLKRRKKKAISDIKDIVVGKTSYNGSAYPLALATVPISARSCLIWRIKKKEFQNKEQGLRRMRSIIIKEGNKLEEKKWREKEKITSNGRRPSKRRPSGLTYSIFAYNNPTVAAD